MGGTWGVEVWGGGQDNSQLKRPKVEVGRDWRTCRVSRVAEYTEKEWRSRARFGAEMARPPMTRGHWWSKAKVGALFVVLSILSVIVLDGANAPAVFSSMARKSETSGSALWKTPSFCYKYRVVSSKPVVRIGVKSESSIF